MHTEWKFEEKFIPFKMLYEEKFIQGRNAVYTAELETGSSWKQEMNQCLISLHGAIGETFLLLFKFKTHETHRRCRGVVF